MAGVALAGFSAVADGSSGNECKLPRDQGPTRRSPWRAVRFPASIPCSQKDSRGVQSARPGRSRTRERGAAPGRFAGTKPLRLGGPDAADAALVGWCRFEEPMLGGGKADACVRPIMSKILMMMTRSILSARRPEDLEIASQPIATEASDAIGEPPNSAAVAAEASKWQRTLWGGLCLPVEAVSSAVCEAEAMCTMLGLCVLALSQFPTGIADDEKALAAALGVAAGTGAVDDGGRALSLKYRLEKKRSVARAAEVLKERLRLCRQLQGHTSTGR